MRERRFAFVLRLWLEHGDQNEPSLLRGSLQAAESDRARYFTSVDDLPALLRAVIDHAEAPAQPREESP
jgi:hypothetical protein